MNGHNGSEPALTGETGELSIVERLRVMRREGWEQTFNTGRKVRLRSLEPHMLLREGDCPDMLTPLLLKCLYGDNRDAAVGEFLEEPFATVENALAYVDLLDLIAAKAIADETPIEELTLAEKKLIFRFSLGSPELLVTFLYKPPAPVAVVEESDDIPSPAE